MQSGYTLYCIFNYMQSTFVHAKNSKSWQWLNSHFTSTTCRAHSYMQWIPNLENALILFVTSNTCRAHSYMQWISNLENDIILFVNSNTCRAHSYMQWILKSLSTNCQFKHMQSTFIHVMNSRQLKFLFLTYKATPKT